MHNVLLVTTTSFLQTWLGKFSRYKLLPYMLFLYPIAMKMKFEEKNTLTAELPHFWSILIMIRHDNWLHAKDSPTPKTINVKKKNHNYLRYFSTASSPDHPAFWVAPSHRFPRLFESYASSIFFFFSTCFQLVSHFKCPSSMVLAKIHQMITYRSHIKGCNYHLKQKKNTFTNKQPFILPRKTNVFISSHCAILIKRLWLI